MSTADITRITAPRAERAAAPAERAAAPRVRHQARDAAILMVFSLIASVCFASVLLLLASLGD